MKREIFIEKRILYKYCISTAYCTVQCTVPVQYTVPVPVQIPVFHTELYCTLYTCSFHTVQCCTCTICIRTVVQYSIFIVRILRTPVLSRNLYCKIIRCDIVSLQYYCTCTQYSTVPVWMSACTVCMCVVLWCDPTQHFIPTTTIPPYILT